MKASEQSKIIKKCASLARGDALSEFYKICELQKSVSTRKIQFMLDDLREALQDDGRLIYDLYKRINHESK